ncbi:FAD-dependent oxidoreductase [Polynucleobacter sp. SHI8]|uniref:NAD(P)/FAD-dependent oxidoreductase n=1 Tax=unclassified Polynucleobacter TaxID=2640945 RepID=UPI002490376B|nr:MULTISPECIES: NAD(P)/FAD-dependent oxidoreductase [unclassified Polynucleobacter]BDW10077.1 FAD-dependent oxidoreductase [Polynucleobacter sp. SHI2]BDW12523.1 FAD-dependent oxidoreductase [Polynucleobacter sp. SHI8]
MDHIEVVVVGAGVVGLAIARELALQGQSVLLVEKEPSFGMSTSSRNSEVIHAGIYYPKDSLKAKLCVQGNRLLYNYAKERGVPFKNYGKLIVACTQAEQASLEQIWHRAQENGVSGLERMTQSTIHHLEPELNALEGIYSPTTGIIDSHSYMLSLLGDFENAEGVISYRTTFEHAQLLNQCGRFVITLKSGQDNEDVFEMSCDHLINCAGLGAVEVAKRVSGLSPQYIPEAYFVKGNYFSLSGKTPFRHLIYPVPEQAGLGVHLTLDLNGRAKFGPDVEHIDATDEQTIDYAVDPSRVGHFENQIRQYWPGLPSGSLTPDYSGVRPKIKMNGIVGADFRIDTTEQHGLPGLINLFGIESPGLTASLAIAQEVQKLSKE